MLVLRLLIGTFINFEIKSEVMIASNDDFMLIRKSLQKLSKSSQLLLSWKFGEVTSMNKDICFWQCLDINFVVNIMSIRHGYDFDRITFHVYKIILKTQ